MNTNPDGSISYGDRPAKKPATAKYQIDDILSYKDEDLHDIYTAKVLFIKKRDGHYWYGMSTGMVVYEERLTLKAVAPWSRSRKASMEWENKQREAGLTQTMIDDLKKM